MIIYQCGAPCLPAQTANCLIELAELYKNSPYIARKIKNSLSKGVSTRLHFFLQICGKHDQCSCADTYLSLNTYSTPFQFLMDP